MRPFSYYKIKSSQHLKNTDILYNNSGLVLNLYKDEYKHNTYYSISKFFLSHHYISSNSTYVLQNKLFFFSILPIPLFYSTSGSFDKNRHLGPSSMVASKHQEILSMSHAQYTVRQLPIISNDSFMYMHFFNYKI